MNQAIMQLATEYVTKDLERLSRTLAAASNKAERTQAYKTAVLSVLERYEIAGIIPPLDEQLKPLIVDMILPLVLTEVSE